MLRATVAVRFPPRQKRPEKISEVKKKQGCATTKKITQQKNIVPHRQQHSLLPTAKSVDVALTQDAFLNIP